MQDLPLPSDPSSGGGAVVTLCAQCDSADEKAALLEDELEEMHEAAEAKDERIRVSSNNEQT